jgi:molybdopterin-binding protein
MGKLQEGSGGFSKQAGKIRPLPLVKICDKVTIVHRKERKTMKISARNQFKGTIIDIQEGAVNGIVKIDIGGGNIVSSTISMNAIKELNLEVGKTAYAIVKATSVMVGIDE